MADYYKNIVDVIDNGAELIVKPEQCLRVMKVIDLIFERKSWATGWPAIFKTQKQGGKQHGDSRNRMERISSRGAV